MSTLNPATESSTSVRHSSRAQMPAYKIYLKALLFQFLAEFSICTFLCPSYVNINYYFKFFFTRLQIVSFLSVQEITFYNPIHHLKKVIYYLNIYCIIKYSRKRVYSEKNKALTGFIYPLVFFESSPYAFLTVVIQVVRFGNIILKTVGTSLSI